MQPLNQSAKLAGSVFGVKRSVFGVKRYQHLRLRGVVLGIAWCLCELARCVVCAGVGEGP